MTHFAQLDEFRPREQGVDVFVLVPLLPPFFIPLVGRQVDLRECGDGIRELSSYWIRLRGPWG